ALAIDYGCDAASLTLEGQTRFGDYQRADLVVRDQRGRCCVVLEAKVDDAVNGFQLQRYRDVPELIGSKALIASLSRIGAHERLTGREEFERAGIRFLDWSSLLTRL